MAVIYRFQKRALRRCSAPPRTRKFRRRAQGVAEALGVCLCVFVIAVAALWLSPREEAGTLECTALRVIDGDTMDCAGTRIRLLGMDTPEMPGHCRAGRDCTPGDPFAAKARLQSLAASGVSCRVSGEDDFGRALARCESAEGDLSCAMLASGHAVRRHDPIFCPPQLALG